MATKPAFGVSIRPRPRTDGTVAFDARFREAGKSRTLSFTTAEAAEKWANVLRAIGPTEAIAYLNLQTVDGAPTVSEYAEKYIAAKSGIEGKTAEHYRMYMRLHIADTLGHLPIDAVSPEMIAGWINRMAAEGWAGKSIKNWHGFLSAVFQSAVDDRLTTRNPCVRSRIPETEHKEMVFLSPDEFTILLAYVPERSQPIIQLLAATGLRWGEATALRPTDLDIDRRELRVSRAWKYSAERGHYIGPPKTKKSKRSVPIPDNLVAIIRSLLETDNEYVFTNQFGRPLRQNRFYADVWEPARRMANGLPAFEASAADPERPWTARPNGVWADRNPASKPLGKWPRVHDLRHSHASWLIGAGIGLDVVQRRLGHESITTTVDTYGHIALERQAHAGDAIGVVLAGALTQLSE